MSKVLSFGENSKLTVNTAILKGSQRSQLSEYEQQEILEYNAAYFLGGSGKKPAHPDRPTNNFGYDDDRGDYLVVNGDHLAYRYEVIDTLGKGSFGQVLSCRDHCTGQMVAIKIIRNKKRFHHQALVEIKILDNLRKWVCFAHVRSVQSLTGAIGPRGEAPRYQDDRAFLLPWTPLHCD